MIGKVLKAAGLSVILFSLNSCSSKDKAGIDTFAGSINHHTAEFDSTSSDKDSSDTLISQEDSVIITDTAQIKESSIDPQKPYLVKGQKVALKPGPTAKRGIGYEGLKARSYRFYTISLEKLGIENDSALYYANEAIKLFENGSLFRLKAEALLNLGLYSNASVACDICTERDDHWDITDIMKCESLKCECLRELFKKFPSQESKTRYEKACGLSSADSQ
jgi:hypothetical protein